MAGERTLIASPSWVDLSHAWAPALRFVLQDSHHPPTDTGLVEDMGDGALIRRTPWWTEVDLQLVGIEASAVLYLFPGDDIARRRLVACLDESVTPLFQLMTGADFGDELTRLVALQWPDFYGMLLASQASAASGRFNRDRVLAAVRTPSRLQWVVADRLPESEDVVAIDHALELIGVSLLTFVRATSFPQALPGLGAVLGGPNQMTRRLGSVRQIAFAGAEIFGALSGVPLPEVIGLTMNALECVKAMRELRSE